MSRANTHTAAQFVGLDQVTYGSQARFEEISEEDVRSLQERLASKGRLGFERLGCSNGDLLRTLSMYVADAIYLFLLYCIASFID